MLGSINLVDESYGKRHLGYNAKARLKEIEAKLSTEGIVDVGQNYIWRMWLNRRLLRLI